MRKNWNKEKVKALLTQVRSDDDQNKAGISGTGIKEFEGYLQCGDP